MRVDFPGLVRDFVLTTAVAGLVACGGGGASPNTAQAPTLVSVALTPLTVSLAPGATQQLTVTGTYSDSSTATLAAADETFTSSNAAVATVSAAGLITVPAGAAVSGTATITVTDTATKISSAASASTVVTVANTTGSGPPSANSVAAATSTAVNNALCAAIQPFYWEIGDSTGALASGSEGTDASGSPVLATTTLSIASASKWLYGMYVMQQLGSAGGLTTTNIPFLNFTSGYTNMGGDVTGTECPNTDSPNDIDTCLALDNPGNGLPYSYKDPTTIGTFNYDAGHLENYASLYGGLGTTLVADLGPLIADALAPNITLIYTEALMAGGITATSNDYSAILRNMLAGNLVMLDVLGTHAVCTQGSATCNATFTPIPEAWHYSIAHWVEDDPSTNGDGAFSSPGAFGFYPWVEAGKRYYGIISREELTGTGVQQGYASVQCGRLIRHAFDTGTVQTATIPSN